MSALLSMILAALPNIFLAILGKVVTESFMQSVIERVLVAGLEKAASMTTNDIDDQIVADIKRRLKPPENAKS